MTQEPYFSLPVVAAPIEQETAVPTSVVSSPDMATNGNEEPVPVQEMPVAVDSSRPQRIRRPAISDDYEVYNNE